MACTIVLVIIVVQVSLAIKATRDHSRLYSCIGHLAFIGQLAHEHAASHDGRFPSSLKDLPVGKRLPLEYLVCAASGNPTGDLANLDLWSDYVVVPGLTTNEAPDTILVHERSDNHPDKILNVLFVDGSVCQCRLETNGILRTLSGVALTTPSTVRGDPRR